MDGIAFKVDGYPPVKGEALSMFNHKHHSADQVRKLLEAARKRIAKETDFHPFTGQIGLEVIVHGPLEKKKNQPEADATNYLGGIGDTLEVKTYHELYADYLHKDLTIALMQVALYGNDTQIRKILYRQEEDEKAAASAYYEVRIWSLAGRQP